jgi:hypothetical protein
MPLFPPQYFRRTEGIHRIGLASAKPAAADVLVGTIYFSTDTGILERSNGVTWATYSGLSPARFTQVAYNAGDFTGSAGMTWTVDVGDILTSKYIVLGDCMIYEFAFGTTSVTAPLGTDLQFKIPGGYTSVNTVVGGTLRVSDNGSVGELGVCVVAAGGTNILFRRSQLIAVPNWTASVNNTLLQGLMAFQVQ